VNRGKQHGQEIEARDQVRPELFNRVEPVHRR
jgi:hypothetical protein